MTNDETIKWLESLKAEIGKAEHRTLWHYAEAIDVAIEALSAEAVPIVYCMDCAKSVSLDEHGALWKCKAHDRTTLRHSYCNNGERKGGDDKCV